MITETITGGAALTGGARRDGGAGETASVKRCPQPLVPSCFRRNRRSLARKATPVTSKHRTGRRGAHCAGSRSRVPFDSVETSVVPRGTGAPLKRHLDHLYRTFDRRYLSPDPLEMVL